MLGLTAQSEEGLADVQQVFYRDSLFSQLAGDTLLVQHTDEAASVFATEDFRVMTLSQNASTTLDRRSLLNRAIALLQANWFLIPGGIVSNCRGLLRSISALFESPKSF
ncbi:MAG: hypothetical protein HC839_04835 [Leptolyngbyaceae cyanobacterium RM2_2_21]|nr:hypothetical protein [Leptolyngbyaceae cyanobacterium RM2_2_21]